MSPATAPSGVSPSEAAALPLFVVTGFLGAGKTTLLNTLLRHSAMAATAVIVNEFGEIGLDHLLYEQVESDLLLLTTGCICCAARGDLLAAIEQLLVRRSESVVAFDRIVVETTGLADPGPILNAFVAAPSFHGAVSVRGVLAVVSASQGDEVLDRHDEARRQVAMADCIAVTCCDLVAGDPAAENALAGLTARLSRLNPTVAIEDARQLAANPAALFALARPFGSVRIPAARPDGQHHHHAADARIRSLVLEAGQVDAARLHGFIAVLQHRLGAALLRLKGLAALSRDPARPAVIQAVGHLLHPVTRLAAWPPPCDRERATRLVVIVDGVDPAETAALWDDFFGGPAIDRPDGAALMMEPDHGGPGLFD